VGGVVEMNCRFIMPSLVFACAVACGREDVTGLDAPPPEVRNAPSTVVIAGTPVGLTGFAFRQYSAAGAAIGETHWTARVVSPPGMALPSITAVELWYVTGTVGQRVTIDSVRAVTAGTDPYLDIHGESGQLNPGNTADVVVKLRDVSGNLFLVRTAGVPVQRYERLE
jgi:hypothetical protein